MEAGRRNNPSWSTAVVAIVLAAALAALLRTSQQVRTRVRVVPRLEYLMTKLHDTLDENIRLREELEKQRAQLVSFQEAVARGQSLTRKLSQELQAVKNLAGLTAMKGPGIIIHLEDSKLSVAPGEDQEAFVVHDSDLLQIVNELRAAGAEAISINGQRLTAISEIRCSGGVIRINNVSVGSPFEIRAIGDPKALKSALTIRGGIVDLLKAMGFPVKIIESKEVVVPGLPSTPTFRYAKPIKPEEAGKAAEAVKKEGE